MSLYVAGALSQMEDRASRKPRGDLKGPPCPSCHGKGTLPNHRKRRIFKKWRSRRARHVLAAMKGKDLYVRLSPRGQKSAREAPWAARSCPACKGLGHAPAR